MDTNQILEDRFIAAWENVLSTLGEIQAGAPLHDIPFTVGKVLGSLSEADSSTPQGNELLPEEHYLTMREVFGAEYWAEELARAQGVDAFPLFLDRIMKIKLPDIKSLRSHVEMVRAERKRMKSVEPLMA